MFLFATVTYFSVYPIIIRSAENYIVSPKYMSCNLLIITEHVSVSQLDKAFKNRVPLFSMSLHFNGLTQFVHLSRVWRGGCSLALLRLFNKTKWSEVFFCFT